MNKVIRMLRPVLVDPRRVKWECPSEEWRVEEISEAVERTDPARLRRLLVEVVFQAARDASFENPAKNANSYKPTESERDEALAWFDENNRDFVFLCHMLDLEPADAIKGFRHNVLRMGKLYGRQNKKARTEAERRACNAGKYERLSDEEKQERRNYARQRYYALKGIEPPANLRGQ